MSERYALGTHYEDLLTGLMESGRYATKSDILREGLRLLEEREQQRAAHLDMVRRAVQEGIESGPGIPAEEVLERLTKRFT